MLRALALVIGDLGDRRVLAILGRSLLVTLLVFAVVGVALAWALRGSDPCAAIGVGECALGGTASGLGALILTALGLWFLFPAVALGVVAAFGDEVVAAVETRHYPAAAARARPLGMVGASLLGLVGSLRVVLYNLVAAPFYVALLVTGVGTIGLFVAVNGLAAGRDLASLAANRHATRAARRAWLRATRLDRWLIGVVVTAMFLVPLVNLLAPMIGAAAMTHLLHGGRRRLCGDARETWMPDVDSNHD